MRYIKVLLYFVSADILSLFICLTLAGSSNPLIRAVTVICTVGILICLLGSLAVKDASCDLKAAHKSGRKASAGAILLSGLAASLIPLASWLTLFFTANSGFDFYRFHKLINGWCLQLLNFINPDASSAALTSPQIILMLPTAFIPAAVYLIAYFLAYRGAFSVEK